MGVLGNVQAGAAQVTGVLGLLALTGCIDPSEKITASLTRYGLDQSQAQCVGDRLEANLSTGQLQELGRVMRAAREGDTTPGRLTAGDLIRISDQVSDLRVPIEVAKATAGCGLLTSASTGS